MNRLRHMSVFAHIVKMGSITAAAESLQLSKSVVSQHLKVLEQELGVALLKRTTRRQTLTSAGKEFYAHCRELNRIAETAWLQAQEALEVPKGHIRVTAPNALMETLVTPVIGELLGLYPLLEFELIGSDHQLDLIADNIDLAIRVGQSKASAIKQRRIGAFRDVLCAGRPVSERDNIEQLAYIANTWQGEHIVHHFKSKTENDCRYAAKTRCTANSFHTCLALIKAGAGIGLIPDFQLGLMKPALYPVFPNHQLPLNSVYALYPYDKTVPLGVSICLTAIEQRLSAALSS